MTKYILMLLTAALGLIIGPAAGAQGFDTGAIEAFASRLFDRIDLDRDGLLTHQEHEQARGGGYWVEYGLLDLNRDGVVTKAEYLVATRRFHPPAHRQQPI